MAINGLVSVVIPVFNAEKYILQTVSSILEQGVDDIEIIIVDDGSIDGTSKLLEGLISEGTVRYKYISNTGGPSIPRNTGIKMSKGECIFFIDSDDLMRPGKIQATLDAYNATRNMDVGLYLTDFVKIDSEGEIFEGSHLKNYETFNIAHKNKITNDAYIIDQRIACEVLIQDNFIGTSSVMIPRKVFELGFYFDGNLQNAEDIDLWLRIAFRFNLVFIDILGHGYRVHDQSITSSKDYSLNMQTLIPRERQLRYVKDQKIRELLKNKLYIQTLQLAYLHRDKKEYDKARKFYLHGFMRTRKWIYMRGIFVTLLAQIIN